MVIYGHRTLLIRCNTCGRIKIYNLNIFNIPRNEEVELSCKCGQKNVSIKTTDYQIYWIKLNCFVCGHKHIYRYTLKELLRWDNTIFCMEDIKICFIGKKENAKSLLNEREINFEKLLTGSGFDNYSKNFKILVASLNKLDRLSKDRNINCDCGISNIVMEVFFDRIELRCLNCNSIQIIYAETEEDLEVLQKKEKIVMHKHNIVYIDSIIEKNKNTKER